MNIYWDLQNHEILSENSASKIITELDLVLRDHLPVTLRLCRPSSSGDDFTVEEPPAGYSVRFGMCLASDVANGTILAEQLTWTFAGVGEDSKAEAVVALDTAALIAVMGADASIECLAEFTLRNASNEDRDSTQFAINIKLDINR